MLESAAPAIAAPESNADLSHKPSTSNVSMSLVSISLAPAVLSTLYPGPYEVSSQDGSSCPPAGTINTPVAALAEDPSANPSSTGAGILADSTRNDETVLERSTGEGHEEASFERGDNIPVRIPMRSQIYDADWLPVDALHRPPLRI